MRRLPLALLLVAALVAVGCGGDDSSSSSSDSSSTSVAGKAVSCGKDLPKGVRVSGELGKQPKIDLDTPLKVTTTSCARPVAGKGRAAKAGDILTMRFDFIDARTGKSFLSSFSNPDPEQLVLSSQVVAGVPLGLVGSKAGSRLVTAVTPADGYGPQGGQPSLGIEKDDSLVFVADVLEVLPPRAHGTAVAPVAGLPTVKLAANGAPTISIPAGATPPTQLVAQRLILGSGKPVAAGDSITVQYTGIIYGSGKVFDSSWKEGREPTSFQVGATPSSLIPAWDHGLVGQPVGSQVLLVVPPAEGYGAGGNSGAGIAGTDTLVFVVDILTASAAG